MLAGIVAALSCSFRMHTPASSPAAPTRSPWPQVLIVLAAGVLSACQVGKAPVALGQVRADLGLDLDSASWLLSAFAVVGVLFGASAGRLVDRFGARQLAIAGLALQALASAAGAAADDGTSLLASRAAEGLGFLAVIVACPTLIQACCGGGDSTRAFAAWSTFMPVGITLVSVAGPLLGPLGWRGFWWLNATVLVVGALALYAGTRRLDTLPPGPAIPRRAGLAAVLRSPSARMLGILFAAYTACYFAVFGFLPTVLAARGAIGEGTAGILVGIAVAAGAIGNLAGGSLLARGRSPAAVLVAAFVVLGTSAMLALHDTLPFGVSYMACIVFSGVGGLIPTTLFALAPRSAPSPALVGTTMGWLVQGNNLGLMLGPALAGFTAGRLGWGTVGLGVAALAFCSGWAAWRRSPHADALRLR